MKLIRLYAVVISLIFACTAIAKPKLEKIRLTGTLYEDVEMTVGKNGRTEIISQLPYEFKVVKKELPIKLTFRSNNYTYVPIEIPKKAVDGHVYLVKVEQNNETAYSPIYNRPSDENTPIIGIDVTKGVNAAPYTGKKSKNTFALIIANENYEMVEKVENATNDGLAVKEYCSKTLGLTDKQIFYCPDASYGKMRKAIKDLHSVANAYNGDINLILYYAGHGIPDNASKDAYIMPIDADGSDSEVCYSLRKMYQEIEAMNINQSIIFLDACFSGAKRDGDMIVSARGVAIKPKNEKPKGSTVVFTATSNEETAFAYKEEKHGLFTYFFLKKMQENKGNMSLGDLADYIEKNVSQQSILINGKKQTPTIVVSDNLVDSWRKMKLTGKD